MTDLRPVSSHPRGWRSALAALAVAGLACIGVACEDEDFEMARDGACTNQWDHFDEHPEGPLYCSETIDSACTTTDSEFYEDTSCGSLGYDFCCETEFSSYRFQSQSDAQWYDELSDPAGSYANCADNPVPCEDEDMVEEDADGEDGDADECTSNSSCGSRKTCQSGRCVSVECTSDSHCGSCSRCSSNVCRDCGSGPYGCYC